MAEIPLTQGKVAIVDDEDFEWLSPLNWYAHYNGKLWYAIRFLGQCNYVVRRSAMHREIIGAPNGMEVDHKNHDTLDNRRENLRLCTVSENRRNKYKSRSNTSGFKGVYWDKPRRKWHASLEISGRTFHLGRFSDPVMAAQAYDAAALKHFGEYAFLNFPVKG